MNQYQFSSVWTFFSYEHWYVSGDSVSSCLKFDLTGHSIVSFVMVHLISRLYSVYAIVYTVQYVKYSVYCTVYTILSILYSEYFTEYASTFWVYIVHLTGYSLHSICKAYCLRIILYIVYFVDYTLQYLLYSIYFKGFTFPRG